MCRFVAYLGRPLLMGDVLIKPKNSLIAQSIHAREQGKDALNADGFGLGWYAHDIDNMPGLFKSIQPAWNDLNLAHIANKIKSECFFAHVRAASKGGVSKVNCHPFSYQDIMLMHNGDIGDFHLIKRKLRTLLNNDIYNWIDGQTDTEHFFALFLNIFFERGKPFTPANIQQSLQHTIKKIKSLYQAEKITSTLYLNLAITNGHTLVACRYVSDENSKAETLYYAYGQNFIHENGKFHMLPAENNLNEAVLIVSEKLTNFKSEWHEIPQNHLLMVDSSFQIDIQPLVV